MCVLRLTGNTDGQVSMISPRSGTVASSAELCTGLLVSSGSFTDSFAAVRRNFCEAILGKEEAAAWTDLIAPF
jgi:hypothetical protein